VPAGTAAVGDGSAATTIISRTERAERMTLANARSGCTSRSVGRKICALASRVDRTHARGIRAGVE